MYPLRFESLFQRYLWGGRKLHTSLHKSIGDSAAAESWEVVDHRDGQSVVSNGSLAGRSLHELVVEYDQDLVGEKIWQRINDPNLAFNLRLRFPLLLKFLDAAKNLSVQVHPDDRLASMIKPPDLGKTEAWFVLDAEPGAKIYAGLQPGVTRSQFSRAVATGDVEPLLHCFEAQVGDCIFIEAGTMHAIGAGLLVAEIQQASNTTYRVFDWNRVDADGNSRELHIDAALEATHFDRGPVEPVVAIDLCDERKILVQCKHFKMEHWTLHSPSEIICDGEFKIVACMEGSVQIEGDPSNAPLSVGQTCFLPACLTRTTIVPVGPTAKLLVISAA